MGFRQAISEYGRQIAFTCRIDGAEYTESAVTSANFHYEGALFHTLMKCLDMEVEGLTGDFEGKLISAPVLSITSPSEPEPQTVAYGSYLVYEQEQSEDLKTMTLRCYDLMLESMVPYDLALNYAVGVTVYDLLQAICNRFGWALATADFVNAQVLIPREMYDNNSTFRQVLDDIAAVAAGTIAFKNDNRLHVLYPSQTPEEITPDIPWTLTVGEKYGKINALVLARTPQEDNIYIQDADSIAQDGLTEIKIENNQLIEAWRVQAETVGDATADAVMSAMFEQVRGLEWYLYEASTIGIANLEPCDSLVLVGLDGTRFPTFLLNSDLLINQGIREQIYLESPTETTTEYTAASKTDRMINQTILRVDKQANEISALVTTATNLENEVTGMEQNVTNALERIDTAERSILSISETVEEGATKVVTETGFVFDRDGLKINKSGEEMAALIDNTGLYVNRGRENILTANNEGVNAINLTARQYLTIGKNSRFEDYQNTRTACFYIGG